MFFFAATHLQQRTSGGNIMGSTWHSPTLSSSPAKAQQIRLQQLQMERERLKQRQQEIRRQQEIMMRSSSDLPVMDPFLSSLTDHSRQESGDSGLGKLIFIPKSLFYLFLFFLIFFYIICYNNLYYIMK